MTCNECSELLSQYIDKEVSRQEEKNISEHLSRCKQCKDEYETMCHAIECVCQNLECVEPPLDFHERVMSKIKGHSRVVKVRWPLWGSLTFASLAAAALLLVTLLFSPFQNPKNFAKLNMRQAAAAKVAQPVSAPKMVQPWENFDQESKVVAKNNVALPPVAGGLTYPTSMVRAVAFGEQPVSSAPPSETTSNAPLLYRQNHEWSGENSSIKVRKHFIVNNPEEARQLWKTSGITPLPLNNMDWNQKALVVLFLGAKSGRGYDIQLKRLEKLKDRLMVYYHVTSPKKTASSGTSHPFIAFELDRSNLPVEFTEE